ncbi:envelope-like protein [Cucumis melo var. makuwa]|uniref:Envelope-like protein n=1 Tax=Cucumis melo var. makuwa TaxID=1194695 RepID=A0A5D3CA29_CUCMM|nr:envelope-like protein [Cucumis melo var. makuwa]
MVNTRKGTYKSTEEVSEPPSPRAAVHGIRVHIPSGSTKSLHEETVSENVMKNVETAPAASEAHLSNMDSDDLDDVPLARLVKKVTAPHAVPKIINDNVLSDQSQESSSSEGVFVPTPDLRQTSSIELGGTEAPNEQNDTPPDNVDDVEPVAPGDHNEEVHVADSVDPSAQQETPLVPTESNPSRKKACEWYTCCWLSVKYAILHKIGIANWFPSSHASSVSAVLGAFLYRICNDDRVDAGAFIYNQLLRHVRSFGVKLLIALPSHVSDINHDVLLTRKPRVFDTTDWDKATDEFFVDKKLASRILNSLTAESRSLATAISLMSKRRLEIHSLIRHLKTFALSSS